MKERVWLWICRRKQEESRVEQLEQVTCKVKVGGRVGGRSGKVGDGAVRELCSTGEMGGRLVGGRGG
jgi:hypothetical protein